MSYKSLLFCPDEKNARVVTQVLTELEFHVELCNEPFAAVKKLMAEHFDAVVVDCENEQNATLLFKSARNSGSNQTSLSVAVVEGQSGVAKAFRIGANLVLTKPINVEQSKGTLRVARGLLRKSEATKPPVAPSFSAPSDFGSAPQPKPSVPHSAFTPPPAPPSIPAMTTSTSSVFELEKEPEPMPEPTEAALLESMSDPVPAKPVDSAGKNSKPYPWQPTSKPMAEPMVSALHAAEAATKPTPQPPAAPSVQSTFVSSQGAATGVAPAKEPAPVEKAHTVEHPDSPVSVEEKSSVKSSSGNNTKVFAIAAVVLIAAGASYFERTRILSLIAPAAKQTAAVTKPAVPTPAAPSLTTESASPTAVAIPTTPAPHAAENSLVAADTIAAPKKAAPKTEKASTSVDATKPAADSAAADALVVKGGSAPHIQQPAAPQDDTKVPDLTSVASNSGDPAISGLMNSPASVPSAAPQTLKISQGVSQGLLVKKVPPIYPSQALQRRLQGSVQLAAVIGKDGNITSVNAINGDPILTHAAIDAVRQWKYKPYYLDGQPVEIQTQITVNFKLP